MQLIDPTHSLPNDLKTMSNYELLKQYSIHIVRTKQVEWVNGSTYITSKKAYENCDKLEQEILLRMSNAQPDVVKIKVK